MPCVLTLKIQMLSKCKKRFTLFCHKASVLCRNTSQYALSLVQILNNFWPRAMKHSDLSLVFVFYVTCGFGEISPEKEVKQNFRYVCYLILWVHYPACCVASLHKKIELVTRNFASVTTISYIVYWVLLYYEVIKKIDKQSIILGHCNMRFG